MFINKHIAIILSLTLISIHLVAQSGTVSPYSRYGYGNLRSGGFTVSNSLGGVGYGLRSNSMINPQNPASYTVVDSLSFMFDFGASASFNQFTSGFSQQQKSTAQFDYLALQIPIIKNMGMSLGLMPFSTVGYAYSFSETLQFNADELLTKHTFEGNGGISSLYGGLAYAIMPQLSLGVNVNYLFGNIVHTRELTFPDNSTYSSSKEESNLYVSTFLWDAGIQFIQPVGKKDVLVVGGTYTLKTPMNIRSEIATTSTQTITDDTNYSFDYPQSIGVGVSYKHGNSVVFAADYSYQSFADALFYSQRDTLLNARKLAIGCEYVPNSTSRSYVQTIRYRLGANIAESYTKVNEKPYSEMGITLGFGLPLKNSKSILNLNLEYGSRGIINQNLVREDYVKIGLGVSINENWFFKRKFE